MKKKGFTLVELLAVIAVLAILIIIALPNVLELFNNSSDTVMSVQEQNVLSAADNYLDDYCIHPINSERKSLCSSSVITLEEGTKSSKKFVCVFTLVNASYIDKVFYRSGNQCQGFVIYDKANNSLDYSNGKTYLSCPGYTTEGIYDYEFPDGEKAITRCGGN